jgi:hypothetical protein
MPPTKVEAQAKLNVFTPFRILRLSQSQFMPAGTNGGLCRAMSVDWIRRILFTGKESYAAQRPKLPPPPPPIEAMEGRTLPSAPLALPAPNRNEERVAARLDQRFAKKGQRLAALQELIHDTHKIKIDDFEDVAVSFARSNARHASFLRFDEASYARLHEDTFAVQDLDDRACVEARAWLGRLLEWMLDSKHENEVVSTAAAREAWKNPIYRRTAKELLHKVRDYPQACFLLDMREAIRKVGETKTGFDISHAEGHAIAFRLDRMTETIVVLEPNFGEYRFALTDRPQLHDFLASVWDFYAVNGLVLSTGTLSMIGMPPAEDDDDE